MIARSIARSFVVVVKNAHRHWSMRGLRRYRKFAPEDMGRYAKGVVTEKWQAGENVGHSSHDICAYPAHAHGAGSGADRRRFGVYERGGGRAGCPHTSSA